MTHGYIAQVSSATSWRVFLLTQLVPHGLMHGGWTFSFGFKSQ
jgi:hypothetical protein